MTLSKLEIHVLSAFTLGSLMMSLVIWEHAKVRLDGLGHMRGLQIHHLSALVEEHQRLLEALAEAKNPPKGPVAEINELRHEADALRMETNRLGEQAGRSLEAQAAQPPWTARSGNGEARLVISQSSSEQYKMQLYKLAVTAPDSFRDAQNLGIAARRYARKHQGEVPLGFDEAAAYFVKGYPAPETSDYELIYRGSLNDLTNIPGQAIALIRQRQPWPTPGGKRARIYVMADGQVRVVESDDGFQAWEAQHIVPPTAAGGQ